MSPWWPWLELLHQHPITLLTSLQLIWRSGTSSTAIWFSNKLSTSEIIGYQDGSVNNSHQGEILYCISSLSHTVKPCGNSPSTAMTLLTYNLNSSPPSAAYMHQGTGPALFQVMACRLFGAKPLPEPILAYCQIDSWEQISVKFES